MVDRDVPTKEHSNGQDSCALYPDPVDGYPPRCARHDISALRGYPDGQTLPTPAANDFTPGELRRCVSGELGLRRIREAAGNTLIVTSDKDGPGAIMDRDAVVRALDCGQLAGYAGDVWYPDPPPAYHPNRTVPHNAASDSVTGATSPGGSGR
jgi:hypothetical protein